MPVIGARDSVVPPVRLVVTVRTSDFTDTIVLVDGRCVEAPARLEWCILLTRSTLSREFRRRNWRASIAKSQFPAPPSSAPKDLPEPANRDLNPLFNKPKVRGILEAYRDG